MNGLPDILVETTISRRYYRMDTLRLVGWEAPFQIEEILRLTPPQHPVPVRRVLIVPPQRPAPQRPVPVQNEDEILPPPSKRGRAT